MPLPPNPEAIAHLYEFIRSLPPFNTIRQMPEADEVEFAWTKDKSIYAQWRLNDERHRISLSSYNTGQTVNLLGWLGHEMAHAAVCVLGQDTGGNVNTHNSAFKRLMTRFCRVHGLDFKLYSGGST